MQHKLIKKLIVFMVVITISFAFGCTIQQNACIKIFDNDTIIEGGDCENAFMKVLFFNTKNELIPSYNLYHDYKYIYVDCSSVEPLKSQFSERRLLELTAFKQIRQMGLSYRIMFSEVLFGQSSYKDEVVPLLFFPSEDQKTLYIKNPFNGDDIDVTDVDYIKFKDTNLLPVPPL